MGYVRMTGHHNNSVWSRMTKHRFFILQRRIRWEVLGSLILLVGCRVEKRMDPIVVQNTYLGPATVAVAPALNLSGSSEFEANRFADLMASELSYTDGVKVIPVSRVLTVLGAQGQSRVESPAHALELIKLLGADVILVFAVTQYDPYDPPSIGISAQLFGTRSKLRFGALDPIALSRQAGLVAAPLRHSVRGLLSQTHRVYDASHRSVIGKIKEFAAYHGADESPYGWRRFVVNQQDFIRFCCHETIKKLFSGPQELKPPDQSTK